MIMSCRLALLEELHCLAEVLFHTLTIEVHQSKGCGCISMSALPALLEELHCLAEVLLKGRAQDCALLCHKL